MTLVPPHKGAHAPVTELFWQAADRLRGSMDAAEYKHVVLSLLYLRYLSVDFEESRRRRGEDLADDPDVYAAEGLRWIPQAVRWDALVERMRMPGCQARGVLAAALGDVTRSNWDLAGVLVDDLWAVGLLDDKRTLELFELFGDDRVIGRGERPLRDVMGEQYEYVLDASARAEGKRGGDSHTPRSVARLLVEMLEPDEGTVYDPCCGTGGVLVEAGRFVEAHRGAFLAGGLQVHGQESNQRTWRLAAMNLDLHGMAPAGAGDRWADTLAEDLLPGLRADFVAAAPPFNMSDWARNESDVRWRYGVPPARNANFAWLQHVVSKLNDHGSAGVVLANGSMSSKQLGEDRIRASLVEEDLVACMVALPARLFRSTSIPACVWFLAKDKSPQGERGLTDRRGEVLFIDARALGSMVGRAERELTDTDLQAVAGTYRAWRGTEASGEYQDVAGFCRSVALEEIRDHHHVLNPGRYVGSMETSEEQRRSPIHERVDALTRELLELLDAADRTEDEIRRHLGP